MSNVIRFLETMGSKPAVSAADYAATVTALDFDSAERQALLSRERAQLDDLLGGRTQMRCLIFSDDEQ